MTGRILTSPACIAEGLDWLARREPRFAAAHALTGDPPLRRRPEGFAELVGAILGQQVSTAAAAAMRARMEAAGLMSPEAVAAADETALRGCGLSAAKIRYVQALARATLDYRALAQLPDAEVVVRLTALPGIGRWTAELYAMTSLGRADILCAGDLALQESARLLFDLEARPGERALRAMAEDWSPWRGVAARLLWAYYRHAKGREGTA
ncbi:DNA-3-methyladenine glycosylase [Cereibacter azotoformans]|uniref:DNA-3-methyladenine glycosylase II n=1 Tax=Cereibacter azotoformans TaxID=43057 RepID=A0A2T5KAT9_9RHOB|nr:DNA-3-methyladenine glycosylase [Cereibacter azotoformans]AXQ93979.1 DNA-3-methyladenine glycosylase 2 family protein [Cereibacter sphaeroides]MBO4168207.1 DNA-3-methyladenine glycosylase 2 family protein [Cereibacter azotoformans]PTR19521.1 DNA-3-methyladenine glycosylase II [Cereibacter azotoformans]UIJ29497.1 DNA-3-methyladenine glycosylase [Cereibacter azotoformans]